jgi:hypothetical protein
MTFNKWWAARLEACNPDLRSALNAAFFDAEEAWDAATAAERERCAELSDELEATYETSKPNPNPPGGQICQIHDFAAAIRGDALPLPQKTASGQPQPETAITIDNEGT